MGTTLVCACLDGGRLLVGNVGDSRCYLVRDGVCLQVTLDHSLLDEQVRGGMLTPAEAAASDLQSVITRAIGISNVVEPDFFAVDLSLDDMLLLTSDGLTRYAKPEDIARIAAADTDLASICHDLIEHAKQGGGADNITCMMLRVVEASPADAAESDATAEPDATAESADAAEPAGSAEEVEVSPPAIEP
jgi:protein phosphatase